MNLKKLPPSMLMALGLGCVTEACLSPPLEPTESSTSGVDTGTNTVGPGRSPPLESTGMETMPTSGSTGSGSDGTDGGMTTGPCLSPPEDTGGSSGSDTGMGSDSSGAAGEAPPAETRDAALHRVLERGSLPPDVAARLRRGREG